MHAERIAQGLQRRCHALSGSRALSSALLLGLQRGVGNQAVQRMLSEHGQHPASSSTASSYTGEQHGQAPQIDLSLIQTIQRKLYYHGRPETQEQKDEGPRPIKALLNESRDKLDFDPKGKGGFYLTPEQEVASTWAEKRAKEARNKVKETGQIQKDPRTKQNLGHIPMVYVYDVADEQLKTLRGHTFKTKKNLEHNIEFESPQEQGEWQKWVVESRQGLKEHDLDFVQGPMLKNSPEIANLADKKKTKEKKQLTNEDVLDVAQSAQWDPHGSQIALYTEQATELFQKNFKQRQELPWDDPEFMQTLTLIAITSGKPIREEIAKDLDTYVKSNKLEPSNKALENYQSKMKATIVNQFKQIILPAASSTSGPFLNKDADKLAQYLSENFKDLGSLDYEKARAEYKEKLSGSPYSDKDEEQDPEKTTFYTFDVPNVVDFLNNNTKTLVELLDWDRTVNPFILKVAADNFFMAYNLKRIMHGANVPYLPEYEQVELVEPPLGTGKYKVVYDIVGYPNQVMGKMKSPDDFRSLAGEIELIAILRDIGLTVEEITGVTIHEGAPAVIKKRYAEQSKDFKAEKQENVKKLKERHMIRGDNVIKKAQYTTSGTIEQIMAIQAQMFQKKVRISDLQFLVGAKGEVVITDPRKINLGYVPTEEGQVGVINNLIAAAIDRLLREDPVFQKDFSVLLEESETLELTKKQELTMKLALAISQLMKLPSVDTQVQGIIRILKDKYKYPLDDVTIKYDPMYKPVSDNGNTSKGTAKKAVVSKGTVASSTSTKVELTEDQKTILEKYRGLDKNVIALPAKYTEEDTKRAFGLGLNAFNTAWKGMSANSKDRKAQAKPFVKPTDVGLEITEQGRKWLEEHQ